MTAAQESKSQPPALRVDDYSNVVWTISKTAVKIWAAIWLRLSARDRDLVPTTGPVILAPNHSSYLDPLLTGCTPRRYVRFLAQKGLAKFAPLRWWLAKIGVRLINRDAPSKDVLRSLIAELQAGKCVSVFPEGTRSPDGSIGPFRNGVEFLVRKTKATVVPVGIHGSHKAFGRKAKMVWPRKCVVTFGEPWPAERLLAPGGLEALRREVARLSGLPLREDQDGKPSTATRDKQSTDGPAADASGSVRANRRTDPKVGHPSQRGSAIGIPRRTTSSGPAAPQQPATALFLHSARGSA